MPGGPPPPPIMPPIIWAKGLPPPPPMPPGPPPPIISSGFGAPLSPRSSRSCWRFSRISSTRSRNDFSSSSPSVGSSSTSDWSGSSVIVTRWLGGRKTVVHPHVRRAPRHRAPAEGRAHSRGPPARRDDPWLREEHDLLDTLVGIIESALTQQER